MKQLNGFSAILREFDGFAIDQWGVLHNGRELYPGVLELMTVLGTAKKDILVITNSSKTTQRNVSRLERNFGILQGIHYSQLVSSAQLLRDWVASKARQQGRLRICVVSAAEDVGLFDDVEETEQVELVDAEIAVLLSKPDEPSELTVSRLAERRVEVLVPSEDAASVTLNGLTTGLAPLVATLRASGVQVHNFGKPSRIFYDACRNYWTSGEPQRVLAVGDQLLTDIVGARLIGWSSALVGTGAGGRFDAAESEVQPDFVVPAFRL